MHFFHPIQQSASHIYHSALPLSPISSQFRHKTIDQKTRITQFYERPGAWGIVVRTITTSSKRFTCTTTFGRRVAAARDDGSVGIYDSITGVLRLSLGPVDHVRAIGGSPDGSVLFCAHQVPSITAWDMQTGGLMHTFVLELNAEHIAVSLGGRYLACGLSDGSVKVWEVAGRAEGAAIQTCSPAVNFCWLKPEERLATSAGTLVHIWDVISGTMLSTFTIRYPIRHIIYSPKLNQLAVMASQASKTTISMIDPQTGTSAIFHRVPEKLTCFAFSQTTEQLMCGMETHGLRLINVSTRRWRHVEHPDTMTSVSSLPNGTIAATFAGSGVQLLSVEGEYDAYQPPTYLPLTVHSFDEGRIIAILPTKRDRIVLLELACMSNLLAIPAQNTPTTSTDRTHVLCASLENRMAVCCSDEWDRRCLQLWQFDRGLPLWTVELSRFPSIGGISPRGTRIVTFHDLDNQTFVCVWDARDGQLEAQLRTGPIHPLDITFDSEERFYLHDDTHRVPYVVSLSRNPTLNLLFYPSEPVTLSHSITSSERLPLVGGSRGRFFGVDETCQWVISDSKRICWIPTGYIGPVQPSYCWIGNSLIMVGQDGALRKLTFREPN